MTNPFTMKTRICIIHLLLFFGLGAIIGQETISSENAHQHSPLSCGFELDFDLDREAYIKEINRIKATQKYTDNRNSGSITCIPVVLSIIRDDNGNQPFFFDTTWVNFIFSKINHYAIDQDARIFLADKRVVDSTALYNLSNSITNPDLINNYFGPLGDPDALNVVLYNSPSDRGGFAPFPNNSNTPQAFIGIRYTNLQETSETPEHEFGHFLGLSHTHQTTEQGNNVTGAEHVPRSGPQANCSQFGRGDGLCDTPADPGFSGDPTDIFGNPYTPDLTNIMSPYTQTRNSFTVQQDSVMEDGLAFRLNDPDYDLLGFVPTTNPVAPTIDTTSNNHLYNYIGWTNVADNMGYIIERSEVSATSGFRAIYNGSVHIDVDYYQDREIVGGVNYWYRVIPVNSADQYSQTVLITSDYPGGYCETATPCNTLTPDSIRIVDPGNNTVLFNDNLTCDPDWDITVDGQFSIVDNVQYDLANYPNMTGQWYTNFWIDLNHDGDFEDADEWLIENVWFGGGGVTSTSFTVPPQTSHGLRAGRMMFSTLFNLGMFQPITSPCSSPMSRFIVDFEIDIQPNPCASVFNLTGIQAVPADFEASGEIISDQVIDANVDYDSGTFIDLLAGFEVKLGRVFHAFIDGCGGQ